MRFKHFCSEKHKADWEQELNVLAVVRLQEARVQMGMEDPQARFAPPAPATNAPSASGTERRTATRVELDAPVRLTILDDDEAAHAGRFVNASAKGMKITMGIQLFLSTRVRVDCGDHSIIGEVRRCHAGGAGYVIGLETIEWIDKREKFRSLTTLGDLYGNSSTPSIATA
jgi:hypothetical protein